EFCEVQIDNCGSNSCENGGTCIAYEDHFKCTCPIGFEGERCELDIDACLFNNISCAPGAVCMDKSHGFNYTCLSPCIGNREMGNKLSTAGNVSRFSSLYHDIFFFSSHFEKLFQTVVSPRGLSHTHPRQAIPELKLEQEREESLTPAQGVTPGQTMETLSLSAEVISLIRTKCKFPELEIYLQMCICPLGYTGTFCELDIDNCVGNQCSQYGFCQDHLHNYSCYCVPGYEGPFCEVEVNECSSSPCKNGATCMDLSGRFSCHCTAGFTGVDGISSMLSSKTNLEGKYLKLCESQSFLTQGAARSRLLHERNHKLESKFNLSAMLPSLSKAQFCSIYKEKSEPMSGNRVPDKPQTVQAMDQIQDKARKARETCSVRINECQDRPCWNGGTCEEDISGFKCNCPF
ncbi:hypothetical protein EK904_013858, partial [Melospiza melodia maxima]